MNNFHYDDDEPLPEWMRPETYRNGGQKKRFGKSLEESIQEVLKKPPINVVLVEPTITDGKE